MARGQDQGLAQGMDRALEESQRLLEEQKKVEGGIDGLSRDKQAASSPEGQRKRDDIIERKNVMAGRVKGLGSQIEELSRQARKDQKEASARLGDAAGIIRDKRLAERIQSNNQLLQGGYYDPIKGREEFIRGNLEEIGPPARVGQGQPGADARGKAGGGRQQGASAGRGPRVDAAAAGRAAGNPQGQQGTARASRAGKGSPGEPGHRRPGPPRGGPAGAVWRRVRPRRPERGGPSPGGPGMNPSGGSPRRPQHDAATPSGRRPASVATRTRTFGSCAAKRSSA